jgi:3-hydroxyacyl-[acyl-carrier-protein] dehydratase
VTTNPVNLSTAQIMELIPHRYPFLLIDRVIECTPKESVAVIKNVTANEPFFQGHFPGNPVMPGVLIIEAMAQAGCVLSHFSNGDIEPRPLYYLAGVDNARFKRPVYPGDQLLINITVERIRRGMWWYQSVTSVDGQTAASATIICAPDGGST